MKRIALAVACAGLALAGCSSGTSTGGDTSGSASASPSGPGPVIESFGLKSTVHCNTGQEVPVEAKWTSQDATEASITVGGKTVAEGLPASGETAVKLKCTQGKHEVGLVLQGSNGSTAAIVHTVRTVPDQDVNTPKILSFNLTPGSCTGKVQEVSAEYATENAQTVILEVDGQDPGMEAGLPTSGTANVPDVPCDGNAHQITLVASAAGGDSVQATQTVRAAGVPVITNLSVASSVHCQGETVPVTVSWSSQNATKAEITATGGVVEKDLSPSGSAKVDLQCVKGTQKIGLIVTGEGDQQASVTHTINVVPSGGSTKAVIDSFSATAVKCTGDTLVTKAKYQTENTESVSLLIDGEDPGMEAGLPTSGSANVPDVPCDGKSHQITLVATGADGKSVQKTQSVGPLLYTNGGSGGSGEYAQ